ncbi:MAG: zinc finger domain-containing protein [[Clostridium] scindens]
MIDRRKRYREGYLRQSWGYKTRLSKNTYKSGCPHCGREIVKASYPGRSVYFCPKCQPLMII